MSKREGNTHGFKGTAMFGSRGVCLLKILGSNMLHVWFKAEIFNRESATPRGVLRVTAGLELCSLDRSSEKKLNSTTVRIFSVGVVL